MDESTTDDTRVLLEKTSKCSSVSSLGPDPSRPMRFLMSRQRVEKRKSNVTFAQEMETKDERASHPSPTSYGYLEHIRSLKPLLTPHNKSLPKNVRAYYEDQLELIRSIEDVLVAKDDIVNDHATAYEKRQKRTIKILTNTTLIVNIILVIIKIVGAVMSKSLSVLSSVVDSAVDLMTSLILIWTARKIKHRDFYKYPEGRTRLEPTSIVILSVIMCSASIQVIYESGQTLNQDIQYFTHQNNGSSTHTLSNIDMSVMPILAMVLTIGTPSLFIENNPFRISYRIKNPTMSAIAGDSRNDVASNVVALICGLLASNALRGKIKQEVIIIDPIGAILISVYIIIAWILQANRQIRYLTGLSAKPVYLQRLTHVVYNYRPDVITEIDSIQAVHLGTDFFVEVDIGLPGSMPLEQAHDIGAELQNRLETIDNVERAFVHLDFECTHNPASDQKIN